jgi:crossover junction endodeoxyribonuclease RusA
LIANNGEMSVEIEFPIEFIVEGTAVSHAAKRPEAIEQWKQRVRDASRTALPEGHFAAEGAISVVLFYFPAAEMQGDVDNIVQPILNALKRYIYIDDHQVERVVVQKFEPGRVFEFNAPSRILQDALNRPKPILYVMISDDPFEDLK